MPRISITDAWKKMREYTKDDSLKLAFASNTGVTGDYEAQVDTPSDRLMLENGEAGQWVFEMYKDTPQAVTEGDRKGWEYPYYVVIVGANAIARVDTIPAMRFPRKLDARSETIVYHMGTKFVNAVEDQKKKQPFDFASATMVTSGEDCSWLFKFYDAATGQIVGNIHKAC